MLEQLKSLADRLEGLSGADRFVDAEIWAAMQGVRLVGFAPRGNGYDLEFSGQPQFPDWPGIPTLTESLDATVALVERATKVEPIAMVEKAIANLLERGWNPNIPFGPQLARAILRALIAAKIEEADTRALALTELAELDAEEIMSIPTADGDGE